MTEIKKLADACKKLDLVNAKLSEEYYYQSLPLCVIDSVFSIGVNYSSTRKVVENYCGHFGLKRIRTNKENLPLLEEQESITSLCEKFDKYGYLFFAENIFLNKQRTSTQNGELKSLAVKEFAQTLKSHKVEYLQDVEKVVLSKDFEESIRKIKGQRSGISLRYFFMLSGSDEIIKPDRMILRFLEKNLERRVTLTEAQKLLTKVTNELKIDYPETTPRLLDHQIWNFQRQI